MNLQIVTTDSCRSYLSNPRNFYVSMIVVDGVVLQTSSRSRNPTEWIYYNKYVLYNYTHAYSLLVFKIYVKMVGITKMKEQNEVVQGYPHSVHTG